MASLRFSFGTMGSGKSTLALQIHHNLSLYEFALKEREDKGSLDYMICDEAQFYSVDQIEQLARVVDELDAEVYAFGLLTSFQGELFEGTRRLLELSDERIEVQVEARCWCGRRATHNARLVEGEQVYDGDLVVVDDPEDQKVTYELRCRQHWLEGDSGPERQVVPIHAPHKEMKAANG